MADLIGWITDIFGMELATIGTTPVTLGYMAAAGLVVAFALRVFKKAK